MSAEIVSTSNERIKRLVRLQRSRKARDAESLFLVEEQRIFERALRAGLEPVETFATPDVIRSGFLDRFNPTAVAEPALSRASYRNDTTGLIALFEYLDTSLPNATTGQNSLFLVVEQMEKPGNLGAMLRIADAGGVAGLVLADPVVDFHNPNVVRASTGAIFSVPTAQASFREVSTWLLEAGVTSIAMTPEAPTAIWDTDLTGNCALWVGAEAEGLSSDASSFVTKHATIPMAGSSDSLNTSVSAAIGIFESVRQRQIGGV